MNFAASHKMQIYVIRTRCNISLYLMRVEIVFMTNDHENRNTRRRTTVGLSRTRMQ